MNSAFLLAAYFTMLLSPCILSEWGDLLNLRWLPALLRRRRTHPQETLLESFRVERYAMAVAAEAAFLSGAEEIFAAPKPFLVQRKRVAPVETPGFLAARQRVAARVAQLVVAQKLRDAAAAEDAAVETQPTVIEIPADVPVLAAVQETNSFVPAAAEPASLQPLYRTLLEAMGLHSSSRRTHAAPRREAVPLLPAAQGPAAVFRQPASSPPRELAEVIVMGQPRGGPDPLPPGPSRKKPGESSDVVEIAA
jgi:hypothetical protein